MDLMGDHLTLCNHFLTIDERVKMCDTTSDWTNMKRGSPQGLLFNPLLGNIYQSNMSAHVKDANLTMYTDDHQLHIKGGDHETAGSRMKIHG